KASGPVKGFAISLTLGILASLFTALIVGRNFLGWFVDTERLKRVSMLHLISSQRINFLGKGFIACMCSLALLLAGAMAFYKRGDRNFGVDFRGGDLVTMSAPDKIDIGEVRNALKPIGFGDASIQESAQGGKSYITVRTPLNTSDKVEKQIIQAMPNAAVKVEGSVRPDFSPASIIGVVVGPYSSIFFPSPIVLWWTRARGRGTTSLRREVTQKATAANPLAQRSAFPATFDERLPPE